MFFRSLFIALLFFAPGLAQAEQSTVWSFVQSQVPGQWQANGLATTPTPQGLRIQSEAGGGMLRPTAADHPVDAVRFTFAGNPPAEMNLIWHPRGHPDGDVLQFPFPAPRAPGVLEMDLTRLQGWDADADAIGFSVGPGTDAALVSMELLHWSLFEKLSEAWKSFWTFDVQTAYSINFLWGPLINVTPISRIGMFDGLPPTGMSGVRLFYIILIVSALILGAHFLWKRKWATWYLRIFLIVGGVLWVLFDVRMGAEILSYHVKDLRTYILEPQGKKWFRNYENFHDVLKQSSPYLKLTPRYVFLTPYPPLGILAQYATYPSVPVRTDETQAGVRHWLVFRGEQVTVNERGELVEDSRVLSPPGRIIKRFDQSSFLFEAF